MICVILANIRKGLKTPYNLLSVIPCHRVIGADGKLVGYGEGLEMKEFLLRLEGIKYPKP